MMKLMGRALGCTGYHMAMKAVILAAGRGTRMGVLTEDIPKPMLTVHGKSLLEHKLESLPEAIEEVVLVVGYHGPKIREHLGDQYGRLRLTYVVQEELNGTAGALWKAAPHLTDRFLVMMGDDLYAREDALRCAETSDWSMLVEETTAMASGGCVITDEAGRVTAIEEGEHTGAGLMNTNMFVLDARLFKYPLIPKSAGSAEYGLPQTVLSAVAFSGIPLTAISSTWWIQITAPEDLIFAEARLASIEGKAKT